MYVETSLDTFIDLNTTGMCHLKITSPVDLEYLQRAEEDRIQSNMLEAHWSTEGALGDLE